MVPQLRKRTVVRKLIATVKINFENLIVYALSDEDAYYEKLSYKKVGSVFEIHQ
mgnify:CR=1 FL=1